MSVTEYDRHQLYRWLEEHMGRERATTMMGLVPPVGWGDVATKRDLDVLRADVETLRAELRYEIKASSERHSRTFAGWLFASQAAVIASMAVLLAID